MPAPRVQKAFRRLQDRLQQHYGGGLKIWWRATAQSQTWTVPIACRETEDRGAARGEAGLLRLDAGSITLHAQRDAFPYAPDEEMTFFYGETVDSGKKYTITGVSAQQMFSHYTITAERAG